MPRIIRLLNPSARTKDLTIQIASMSWEELQEHFSKLLREASISASKIRVLKLSLTERDNVQLLSRNLILNDSLRNLPPGKQYENFMGIHCLHEGNPVFLKYTMLGSFDELHTSLYSLFCVLNWLRAAESLAWLRGNSRDSLSLPNSTVFESLENALQPHLGPILPLLELNDFSEDDIASLIEICDKAHRGSHSCMCRLVAKLKTVLSEFTVSDVKTYLNGVDTEALVNLISSRELEIKASFELVENHIPFTWMICQNETNLKIPHILIRLVAEQYPGGKTDATRLALSSVNEEIKRLCRVGCWT